MEFKAYLVGVNLISFYPEMSSQLGGCSDRAETVENLLKLMKPILFRFFSEAQASGVLGLTLCINSEDFSTIDLSSEFSCHRGQGGEG